MVDVLWIEGEENAAAELPYRLVLPDEALELVDEGARFDAVAVGTSIDEPVRLTHELRARDEALEILIVCQPERAESLREAIRFDPFVGEHTRVVSADETLRQKVEQAAEEGARRRRYHEAVSSAQAVFEGDTAPARRPAPLHYAATVWSSAPVAALAILRGSLHIVSANRAATLLFDEDEIDLIGRSLDALFFEEAGRWDWLTDVNGESRGERVISWSTGAGETTHLEVRAVDVDHPGREIVLLFLWDVSERIRIEQMQAEYLEIEREAREKAEEASRAREEVLGSVSHDLRGPLQTLLSSSQVLEVLATDGSDSRLSQVAQTIAQSTEYMKKLVDDLLDVARIEGGGLSLDVEVVAVADLVERAAELCRGAAVERGIDVHCESGPSSLVLRCDPTRVVQLLQNLLLNAIKFSPEGESVSVSARTCGDAVCFSVADSGPGIPESDIPHLFTRFWKRDRDGRRGAGLGLAIVRGIVDAHNGEISVESNPDRGSVFRVELPSS